MPELVAPCHGGHLQLAALEFGIPESEWLDVSTGINPSPWPVPAIPDHVWQRLPESELYLNKAAERYYGQSMLAIPGSQWAIQQLPALFSTRRVWLPRYCYEEHDFCWRKQGHSVENYDNLPVSKDLTLNDVVIVVNPNNPTAQRFDPDTLRQLAAELQAAGGTLIVDEAFMDYSPEFSLLQQTLPANIIVLRSVGKFYGLAGLRLGFVKANETFTHKLSSIMGPWAVSHPALYLGEKLLQDTTWQNTQKILITERGLRLSETLQNLFPRQKIGSCGLFSSIELPPGEAQALYRHCGQQAVLIRCFPNWNIVRFGLCLDHELERLASCLDSFRD